MQAKENKENDLKFSLMPNMYVSSHVNVNDSYAQMARNNLEILKEKFNKFTLN